MKEVLQYLNIAAVFIGFAIYAYFANKWENRHRGTPRKGGSHLYGDSPDVYGSTEPAESGAEHYIA
jgi:hypothetical protein